MILTYDLPGTLRTIILSCIFAIQLGSRPAPGRLSPRRPIFSDKSEVRLQF